MTNTSTGLAQTKAARLAGAMYLFVNATGIFSEIFVRGALLRGDVTQVARNISDSERLYRLGIVGDLVTFAGVVVLTWALYVLLKPVHKDLALLAAIFRIVEVPVGVAAAVGSLIAVQLISGAEYLRVFEASELHALSRLARSAFGFGQDVGFIFIGLGSAIFAYLLLLSRYVPRLLAGWGILASLFFATYNLGIVVFPSAADSLMYFALAPMGIYEIGVGFWLLLRGAPVQIGDAGAA